MHINSVAKVGSLSQNPRLAALLMAGQSVIGFALILVFSSNIPLILFIALLAWSIISGFTAFMFLRESSRRPGFDSAQAAGGNKLFGTPDPNLNLSALSSLIQEGMLLIQDQVIIYANASIAYLLGAGEDELIGDRIGAFILAEDMELLGLTDNMPGPSRATMRLRTLLGDQRWVICSAHSVQWNNIGSKLLLVENIGPLKQAQQALEERELQSRILIERTPLGIAMFDSLGNLKLSNTTWHSLWSDVVNGTNATKFNILQDSFLSSKEVARAIRQVFNKQESGVSNLEHAAPWGETRWLNINFHPMLNTSGYLTGVVMTQQDITDHVRSSRREHELSEQLTALRLEVSLAQNQLFRILDVLPCAAIALDAKNTVTAWNLEAENMFGFKRNSILGQNIQKNKLFTERYLPFLAKLEQSGKAAERIKAEHRIPGGLVMEEIGIYSSQGLNNTLNFFSIWNVTAEVCANLGSQLVGSLSALGRAAERLQQLQACSGNDAEKEYVQKLAELRLPSPEKNLVEIAPLLDQVLAEASMTNRLAVRTDYNPAKPLLRLDAKMFASAFRALVLFLTRIAGCDNPEPPELFASLIMQDDILLTELTVNRPMPWQTGSEIFDPTGGWKLKQDGCLIPAPSFEQTVELAKAFLCVYAHGGCAALRGNEDSSSIFIRMPVNIQSKAG